MTSGIIERHALSLDKRLKTAVSAAYQAGKKIRLADKNRHKKSLGIIYKKQNDLVTEIDKASEKMITGILKKAYPEIPVLGEEFGLSEVKSGPYWIVDPIDGTTNFAHGFPQFSVSIALAEKNKILLGCVYEVVRDEMFYAANGKGAFLNKLPISVTKTDLSKSLIATGFPYHDFSHLEKYIGVFQSVMQKTHGIRRAGSAASDLAYTAAGRFDGFWEYNLKPWDVAAGLILVKEAGGIITDFSGGKDMLGSGNVVAGGKKVQKQLLDIVREMYGGNV